MKVVTVFALGIACFGCSHRQASVLEPPMSVADLQKEIDPSFRLNLSVTKQQENGWAFVIEAAGLMPSDTQFRDSYDSPTRKTDARPDSAAGLLSLSSELSAKEYVEHANRMLKLYGPSLEALDRALAKPKWDPIAYQCDLGLGPEAAPPDIFTCYKPLRELAKAKITQAIAKLYQGDLAGAISSFKQVRTISDRLDQMHYGYTCVVISGSIRRFAVQHAILNLSNSYWNPNALYQLMYVFDEGRTDDLLRESAKSELALIFIPVLSKVPASMELGAKASDTELLIKKLLEDHPHPLDRKTTVKDASLLTRDDVERSIRSKGEDNNQENKMAIWGAKWPRQVFDNEPMSEADLAKGRTELRSERNPLGKYLIADVLLAPTFVAQGIYTTEALFRMAKIDVAIEIYRRRYRIEPRTLADLVKKRCIRNLHPDPFSGKSFGYSSDLKLVWSVGLNKVDDGGNMGDGIAFMNSDRPDIVLPSDSRIWLERMRYYSENKPKLPPYPK